MFFITKWFYSDSIASEYTPIIDYLLSDVLHVWTVLYAGKTFACMNECLNVLRYQFVYKGKVLSKLYTLSVVLFQRCQRIELIAYREDRSWNQMMNSVNPVIFYPYFLHSGRGAKDVLYQFERENDWIRELSVSTLLYQAIFNRNFVFFPSNGKRFIRVRAFLHSQCM